MMSGVYRIHDRPAHPKRVLYHRIRLHIAMIRALRAIVARGIWFKPEDERDRKRDLASWQDKFQKTLAKYRATPWRER